jgi:hypothetical protein
MAVDLHDLEQALLELADSLEFPGEDELAERVGARLDEPQPAASVVLLRRPAVRRALAVAVAAVLLLGVVLIASPRARRVAADLLGIGGVEIRSASSVPTSAPVTFPTTLRPDVLGLGQPTALADGAARLGIPPPVPAALGPPVAAYFAPVPRPSGELTLVWAPGPSLPPSKLAGVGALVTVFEARMEEGYFAKILRPGTTYQRVRVNGRPAAWLAGEPHVFLYPAGSSVEEEELRLAGNTLLWAVGPYTYRLESALDRNQAIALAETIPT